MNNQNQFGLTELVNVFDTCESLSKTFESNSPYDIALELLSQREKTSTFVQIGANDGETGDPLRSYIKNGSWKGVMVEPHPRAFEQLKDLYKDQPHIILVNEAITTEGKQVELLVPDSPFGTLTATVDKQSGWASRSDKCERILVDSTRLSSLLQRLRITCIDVLQIDVEGYDFEVLKTLDFSIERPMLINYEDRHFFPPKKRREAVTFLRNLGYQVCVGLPPQDTLAIDLDAFVTSIRVD